ncbi:hypothetical protein LSAT2_012267, partial [Lamellibrachia satsuma]
FTRHSPFHRESPAFSSLVRRRFFAAVSTLTNTLPVSTSGLAQPRTAPFTAR